MAITFDLDDVDSDYGGSQPMDSLQLTPKETQEEAEDEAQAELEEQQEGETQPQSTQEASATPDFNDLELWGYLAPEIVTTTDENIYFRRNKSVYSVGLDVTNDVVLVEKETRYIGRHHCTITWSTAKGSVQAIVKSLTTNGTYIQGRKVYQDNTKHLYDKDSIKFGEKKYTYHTLQTPQVIKGSYVIKDRIGQGAYGTVMTAIHTETNEWCAVKILSRGRFIADVNASNSQMREWALDVEYRRELNILKTLHHPNVCGYKDHFTENDDIYMVLELVEGGNLHDFIVTRARMSEDMARHITKQICDAMAYIHSQGIAHRDLKPANILLTNNAWPTVKVADFGLSKVADALTSLRSKCGTPLYMAPEIILNAPAQSYTLKVDSWSVGLIVFFMLTQKQMPFDGTYVDSFHSVAHEWVEKRQMKWEVLDQAGVSISAKSFIKRLIVFQATERVALAEIRTDPWLHGIPSLPTLGNTSGPSLMDGVAAGDDIVMQSHESCGLPQDARICSTGAVWNGSSGGMNTSTSYTLADDLSMPLAAGVPPGHLEEVGAQRASNVLDGLLVCDSIRIDESARWNEGSMIDDSDVTGRSTRTDSEVAGLKRPYTANDTDEGSDADDEVQPPRQRVRTEAVGVW